MAHSIELAKDAEYVHLVLVGELKKADHEIARANAAHALAENGWNKLLVDTVQAKPIMSVNDDFDFTRDHQLHFPMDLRTAIIHHPDKSEGFKFIENVGRNRGMMMKVFTDRRQAIAWLIDD